MYEEWSNKAKGKERYPWEAGGKKPSEYTWDEFNSLNGEQQEAFVDWFASADEFEVWMNSVH